MVDEEEKEQHKNPGGAPPPPESSAPQSFSNLKRYIQRYARETKKDEDEHAVNERAMRKWTGWVAVFTFVLCIIGAVSADIAFRTLDVIHDQLTEMQETRKDTERLFRTDERAWVELGEIKIAPLIGVNDNTLFSYEVSPKNVGKTSAHDVTVYAASRPGSYNLAFDKAAMAKIQDEDLVFSQQPLDGANLTFCADVQSIPRVLGPNSQAPIPLRFIGSAPDRVHKPDWEYTYLIGRINYSDAFGPKTHWLKFCMVVEDGGQGTLRQCQEGNDEDRD